MKTKVLVTGANGQLAQTIKHAFLNNNYAILFDFLTKIDLDITSQEALHQVFEKNNFKYCINCAAYTAVDKAETDFEKAYNINTNGAKNLAEICSKNRVVLIHISTDFVFDGKATKPYLETDLPNPLGVYGETKLQGEQAIRDSLDKYFIIRTSWLYSEYSNNFLKTMLRLATERSELSVVSDQIGSPTYAKDLAEAILKFIKTKSEAFGTYHYSNTGEISWYDFAKEIFEQNNQEIKLNKIETKDYSTPAKRPRYSVLDNSKIQKTLALEIPNWKNSLSKCLSNLNNENQS